MTLIKKILLFATLLTTKFSFSQNSSFTNVDTTVLRQVWQKENLSVTQFNNGDPINRTNSILIWKELSLKFEPTVFIGEENQYYYNFYAINDKRGLCPVGYKVPSFYDVEKSSYTFKANQKGNQSSDFVLYLDNTGYIQQSADDIYNVSRSSSSTMLGTNTSIDEYNYIGAYFYAENGKTTLVSEESSNLQGLSVRCIEDMDYSLKTKEYSYKDIMPFAYKTTVNAWVNSIKETHSFKKGESVRITATLGYSRNGLSRFSLNGIETVGFNLKSKTELESLINNATKKHLAVPYYRGQVVHSLTQVDLIIHYYDSILKKQWFNIHEIKNKYSYDYDLLNRAENFGFRCQVSEQKFEVSDNFDKINIDLRKGITRFKGRGPIYAFGAVIPGMGLIKITSFNSSCKPSRGVKYGILISSISVGAISVASKIYSTYYYRKYKSSSFDLEKNYDKANVSQKVFLSSAIAYGALSLIDFTWTFTIGVKNKTVQSRLNSEVSRDKPMYLNI